MSHLPLTCITAKANSFTLYENCISPIFKLPLWTLPLCLKVTRMLRSVLMFLVGFMVFLSCFGEILKFYVMSLISLKF